MGRGFGTRRGVGPRGYGRRRLPPPRPPGRGRPGPFTFVQRRKCRRRWRRLLFVRWAVRHNRRRDFLDRVVVILVVFVGPLRAVDRGGWRYRCILPAGEEVEEMARRPGAPRVICTPPPRGGGVVSGK